jgi:putative protein-disulfide isomerase
MDQPQEIIYVGDPMCSWCWGIAPQLDELRRRLPELPFRIVTGGLRPGPDAKPIEALAGFLEHEWTQIAGRTGQPFDHSLLGRPGWLYDTEPACRAVAVMRALDPPRAWPLFKRIQRAFYAEGVLTTAPEVFPPLVEDVGGDAGRFLEAFTSDQRQGAAWADFGIARGWGVTSFPTVIARVDDQGFLLTVGYATADTMLQRLPDAMRSNFN